MPALTNVSVNLDEIPSSAWPIDATAIAGTDLATLARAMATVVLDGYGAVIAYPDTAAGTTRVRLESGSLIALDAIGGGLGSLLPAHQVSRPPSRPTSVSVTASARRGQSRPHRPRSPRSDASSRAWWKRLQRDCAARAGTRSVHCFMSNFRRRGGSLRTRHYPRTAHCCGAARSFDRTKRAWQRWASRSGSRAVSVRATPRWA